MRLPLKRLWTSLRWLSALLLPLLMRTMPTLSDLLLLLQGRDIVHGRRSKAHQGPRGSHDGSQRDLRALPVLKDCSPRFYILLGHKANDACPQDKRLFS
mmetsp:Transcript_14249/g.21431  ORF Transcript_14249/g.21431 Transcript_14249/m.21431 type:complete len:99 (-) Transcript_14249:1348-1644(-)